MLEGMNRSLSRSLARLAPSLLGAPAGTLPAVPMSEAELDSLEPTLPPWPCSSVPVAGARLNVRHAPADGQRGQPGVVYVHGLGGSATNWTDLQGLLAPTAAGVAVDLPGFGFSEPAADFAFTLEAHAQVLAEYLDGLDGEPVHLVGNSMGGAIALLTAARRPELVRTLTLISPAMPDRRPDPRRLSDPRLALAYLPVVGKPVRRKLAEEGPRERARKVIELCYADPSRLSEQRLDEMAEELAAVEQQKWAGAAMSRSTADIFRFWLRFGSRSLWSIASSIDKPALVVWGDQDKLVSVSRAARTATALPRARLLVLPGTGHIAQMERPEKVARAILGMWDSVAAGQW